MLFSIFSFQLSCWSEFEAKFASLEAEILSWVAAQVVQHSWTSHRVLPCFQPEQGSKPTLTPLKTEINPDFKIVPTGSMAGGTKLWVPPLSRATSTTQRRNAPPLTLTYKTQNSRMAQVGREPQSSSWNTLPKLPNDICEKCDWFALNNTIWKLLKFQLLCKISTEVFYPFLWIPKISLPSSAVQPLIDLFSWEQKKFFLTNFPIYTI